ncbi:DEAD/DEAH box helicase [Persicimonas caeni]|uniref:DEAD/DEAH box helicase n=1 Tax=Persicimonas caeni TaxID=2292766 RepID=UPI001C9A74BE|nr:DEAD/DEAH box helicase [Persicimonas caeni]
MKTFKELDLIEPLQRAIAAENYRTPTPIQAQSIPPLLEGRDMLGCAQTGTGKTAAFSLPVLQHLHKTKTGGKRQIRAVILSPTRELAAQIQRSCETYGRHLSLKSTLVFGGVSEKPQIRDLKKGVDLVVACPGRFLDLMGRGFIDLSKVECFVLDEADRMLDMGFIHDIRKIMKQLPKRRQNLLFSATLPKSIVDLANQILHNPVRVEIAPEEPTVDKIDQRIMFVEKRDKKRLIVDLLGGPGVARSIVFTRTKHGANRLAKRLGKAGFPAIAIHGNKSQNTRQRALKGFKDGKYDVLVATDVASRGIDVDDITHVFQFDLPDDPESYVHRIGRTGRAGREGVAISFCDESEAKKLRKVERVIGQSIPTDEDHEYHHQAAVPSRGGRGGRNSRGGGGGKKRRRNNRGGGRKRRRGRR